MTWFLVGLGGLVALVILAALVGATLPRAHVASVRVRVACPPEQAWSAIRDFASWPRWDRGVKSMERLPDADGRERWRMATPTGGFPSRVEVSEPPAADRPGTLRTRIDDPSLPFGGTWTWEVARDGPGTVVTVTEDGEIRNPVFRLLARTVFGFHGTMEKHLAALSVHLGSAAPTERVA